MTRVLDQELSTEKVEETILDLTVDSESSLWIGPPLLHTLKRRVFTEPQLWHVAKLLQTTTLYAVGFAKRKYAIELWNTLHPERLAARIMESRDFDAAALLIETVRLVTPEITDRLCDNLDLEILAQASREVSGCAGQCLFIASLFKAKKESGMEYWRLLDLDVISRMISRDQDLLGICVALERVFKIDSEIACELWRRADRDEVAKRISEDEPPIWVASELERIAQIDAQIEGSFGELLNVKALVGRMSHSATEFFIKRCMYAMELLGYAEHRNNG